MPSMEMYLSVTRLLREGDHARKPREDLVEQHADNADRQDRDDDIGDRKVVPLVPDEVTDAGTADEHFGGDDNEPGDADGNTHARQDRRGRGGQDHGEGAPDSANLQRARDVDPFLADTGHA